MKSKFLLLAVSCWLSAVHAQWLETTIPVGGGPWELMYVPSVNKVYCANDDPTSISIIDCVTNTVRATVAIPNACIPLAWSDTYKRVYVGSQADRRDPKGGGNNGSSIVVIDAVGDTVVADLTCADSPGAAAYCKAMDKLYVMCTGTVSAIEVVDAARDAIVKRISLPLYAEGIGWCPTTNLVFFANDLDDSMRVIDCSNDQVRALRTGHSAFDMVYWNPIDGRVYTGQRYAICVFDATGDTLIDSIIHPAYSPEFCFAPYPNKCFIADFNTMMIYTADLNARSLVDSFYVEQVYCMVLDSICGRIHAALPRSGEAILDARGDSLIKVVPLTDYPAGGIAWSARERRVYVPGYYTNMLYVIKDTTTGVAEPEQPHAPSGKLEATVVRSLPRRALAFDAMGRRVLNPRSGVFFVREPSAVGGQPSAVTKVVITR